MSRLLDSSEMKEAARLFADLMARPPAATAISQAPPPARAAARPALSEELKGMAFRGDKLEHVLAGMCLRGGFTGAAVADGGGLPLAVFQSPLEEDKLAAFTSVLGGAMEKAAMVLGHGGADGISMDIDYADKLAMRRFLIDNNPYFILVICPQLVDERGEIEVSVLQLTAILTGE